MAPHVVLFVSVYTCVYGGGGGQLCVQYMCARCVPKHTSIAFNLFLLSSNDASALFRIELADCGRGRLTPLPRTGFGGGTLESGTTLGNDW